MVKLQNKRLEIQEKRLDGLKSTVLWLVKKVFSGWVGILVYAGSASIALISGALWGINTPSSIPCPSKNSLCYHLRFDKTQILLPEQIDQMLEKYGLSNQKKQSKSKGRK